MKTAFALAWPLLLAATLFTAAEEAARTCRIVFPDRPAGALKSAYLFDGKVSQQVTLPSMNFSPVLSIPGGALTLSLTKDPVAVDANPPKGAPSLEIPDHVRHFYLLLSADEANPVCPLQMELVDASPDQLRAGEILWLNRTGHLIEAQLGEKEISVEASGSALCGKPVEESGYYRAEFRFQPAGQKEMKQITEQQWWHDVNSRHLGFIMNSTGKLPKIFFFRDFRAP